MQRAWPDGKAAHEVRRLFLPMASEFLCHTEVWEESQEDFLKGKGDAGGHPASVAFENQP